MEKVAPDKQKAICLVEEYIKLSKLSFLSDSESERISEILTLAMDNELLNSLIREAEQILYSDFDAFDSAYYQKQMSKVITCINAVDQALNLDKICLDQD